jgi:hypothetical protein
MTKVALKLASKSTPNLVIFSRNVHDHMLAAAATFAAPPVTMADLGKHTDDLEKAQSDAVIGNHGNFVIRDVKRAILETDLNALGSYVDIVAKGSENIIVSAGMEAKKSSVSYKLANLSQPTIRKIYCEQKGTLSIRWNPVPRAVNFALEYTNDPTLSTWQNGTYTTWRKFTFDSFNSDTRYWVRIRAMGKNGIFSDWSDPVSYCVQ